MIRRRAYTAVSAVLITTLGALVLLVLVMGFGMATGSYRVLPVLSGSMAPTLNRGDLLVAHRIAPASVQVNDVVVVHAPEDQALLVHRVLSVRSQDGATIVRTKGDANPAADAWETKLSDYAVLRVDHSLRVGSTPLWHVASPQVLGLLRMLLFPAFVYFAFRWIWKKPRKAQVSEG